MKLSNLFMVAQQEKLSAAIQVILILNELTLGHTENQGDRMIG